VIAAESCVTGTSGSNRKVESTDTPSRGSAHRRNLIIERLAGLARSFGCEEGSLIDRG